MTTRIPSPPPSASPPPPTSSPPPADEGDADAEAPSTTTAAILPLSASIHISQLPSSVHTALRQASTSDASVPEKITIRLQPVGSAPALRQRKFKISAGQSFGVVVSFVGRKLGLTGTTGEKDGGVARSKGSMAGMPGVFCYVNSVFAPSLDQIVGDLWRCFKVGDELVVAYAIMPAFG